MSDSAHTVYWKNSIKISPTYSFSGYSRAAENTGFYCKELEMAFDAGVQMNDVPAFICLTHLHNDHMCSLNKMLIGNPKNPTIFIPNNDKFEELLVNTLKYIYLSSKFIHPDSAPGKDPKRKYPYQIVKLDVGQSFKFKENSCGTFYVEGLPSEHGVASISFGIYEMRKRCKEQYRNLDRSAYAQLKADGIDFIEFYRYPIICYMSDTNYLPFKGPKADLIFNYQTIVIECSFIEKDDLKHAKKKNHMHWDHLFPFITEHPNIKFILTHFSKKYTWPEIKFFFDKINRKTPLSNVIIWLHTGPVDYSLHNKTLLENTTSVETATILNQPEVNI